MKILQINKHAWPHFGGIEKIVADICESVADESFRIDVLCVNEGERKVEEGKWSTIFRAASGVKILSMPLSWDFFRLSRTLIPQYDRIIVHHPFPLGFLVAWLFAKPGSVIVWYHSDIVRQRITGFLIQPLLHFVLKRSISVIVSDFSIAQASSILPRYKNKIVEIPFAVDERVFNEESRKEGERIKSIYNAPIVLSVGRLVYYKGFQYLVEAMKDVDAHLLIIGAGPLKDELERNIEELRLNNVTILDPVSNLIPYYYACDLFVLPSIANSEAFGIVQMEAMAAGKPVINTSLPTGASKVSINGVTGITVPPKNSRELANAISSLLANDDLRHKYGEAAKQRVRDQFSRTKFAERVKRVIG